MPLCLFCPTGNQLSFIEIGELTKVSWLLTCGGVSQSDICLLSSIFWRYIRMFLIPLRDIPLANSSPLPNAAFATRSSPLLVACSATRMLSSTIRLVRCPPPDSQALGNLLASERLTASLRPHLPRRAMQQLPRNWRWLSNVSHIAATSARQLLSLLPSWKAIGLPTGGSHAQSAVTNLPPSSSGMTTSSKRISKLHLAVVKQT